MKQNKKRKVSLTIYANDEQVLKLQNYLENIDTSFLFIENYIDLDTNHRYVNKMCTEELSNLIITMKYSRYFKHAGHVYSWLREKYNENDEIWSDMSSF